jgi:hypothetical protein
VPAERQGGRRSVVLAIFIGDDAFPPQAFRDGAAHRHTARLLALRLLRDSREARAARRGRGVRLGRTTIALRSPGPFDHAIGRLDIPSARARRARLTAEFHLGHHQVGRALVGVRLGPGRRRSTHGQP